MSTVHVIFKGQNEDLDLQELFPEDRFENLNIEQGTVITANTINQDMVRRALSYHYDVSVDEFEDHYVEINPNGNVTVRPEATFG